MVILVQDPAAARLNLLVTLARTAHTQSRVHMHVMAGHVDGDQALENNRPPRPGGAQEHQQTCGGAAVRDHVQHGSERGGLVEVARGVPVQGIQKTRDSVEDGAGSGVEGHIVQRGHGQDDARVPCRQQQSASIRHLGKDIPTDEIRRK